MEKHPYIALIANLLRLAGNLCHLMSLALLESFGIEDKGKKAKVLDIKPRDKE